MWKEFKVFIARGNVVDLAVAVVIGAAFGRIVTSFVEEILMPPIGLLLGKVDFSSLFWILDESRGIPASVEQAKQMGVPVIAYGSFINTVINFLIVAFVVFLVVRAINRVKEKPREEPTVKSCPFCQEEIPKNAIRCGHCTSKLNAEAARD